MGNIHSEFEKAMGQNTAAKKDKTMYELQLKIGSDVELAKRLAEELQQDLGDVVFAEGSFWSFNKVAWASIDDNPLRLRVQDLDGLTYPDKYGVALKIKLGKSRINSILYELATILEEKDFFKNPDVGITCLSGFIEFPPPNFAPILTPHDPKHCARHVIEADWPPPQSLERARISRLQRFLLTIFGDDADLEDKIALISEIMGCIILGYATKLRAPKAIVFYGPTAENGKSQVLELFRSLLPESATSSIPIHTLGDERHAPKLAGVMLNASDELSGSKATSSDVFKKFVTGDPVHGREVFMRAFTFKPTALHIFATNTLPVFRGGFDNGLKRRLLVLEFSRKIPANEQIADIAKLIVGEEADLCLDFAMAGAVRLLKNGEFTVPKSSKLALEEWSSSADSFAAWIESCLVKDLNAKPIKTRDLHSAYRLWSEYEGYAGSGLIGINKFTERFKALPGISYDRTRKLRLLTGISQETIQRSREL